MTKKRIRVFEAFAGIGTQRMALRNLGIPHDVVAIAEIDKFAIKSYEAVHGETFNVGDISKVSVEEIPDHDLLTYSFPCQDISVAGLQNGLDKGTGTRSSLLWECERIIKAKRPKYLMLENVKNLVGKKNKANFETWLDILSGYGYTNYWQVLNAKDYGVPQNRERVFVISILGEHTPYQFPKPIPLTKTLKDVLEDEVPEKYYLSEEKIKHIVWGEPSETKGGIHYLGTGTPNYRLINNVYSSTGISPALTTAQGGGKTPQIKVVGNTSQTNHHSEDIYDSNGIVGTVTVSSYKHPKQVVIGASRGRHPDNPSDRTAGVPTRQRLELNKQDSSDTITTVQKDNDVVEPLETLASGASKQFGVGYLEATPKEEFGRMGRQAVETLNENDVKYSDTINPFNKRISSKDGISPTLTTRPEGFKTAILPVTETLRVRKLTPKECWRLMGCSDEDFNKAAQVNSNTQLYKQAGNAIVVNVLEALFKKLFFR